MKILVKSLLCLIFVFGFANLAQASVSLQLVVSNDTNPTSQTFKTSDVGKISWRLNYSNPSETNGWTCSNSAYSVTGVSGWSSFSTTSLSGVKIIPVTFDSAGVKTFGVKCGNLIQTKTISVSQGQTKLNFKADPDSGILSSKNPVTFTWSIDNLDLSKIGSKSYCVYFRNNEIIRESVDHYGLPDKIQPVVLSGKSVAVFKSGIGGSIEIGLGCYLYDKENKNFSYLKGSDYIAGEGKDVCSNIEGVQLMPPSTTKQSGAQCVCKNGGSNPPTCTPPVVDKCSNITGSQATVPTGTYQSGTQCLCSNGKTNPPTCTTGGPVSCGMSPCVSSVEIKNLDDNTDWPAGVTKTLVLNISNFKSPVDGVSVKVVNPKTGASALFNQSLPRQLVGTGNGQKSIQLSLGSQVYDRIRAGDQSIAQYYNGYQTYLYVCPVKPDGSAVTGAICQTSPMFTVGDPMADSLSKYIRAGQGCQPGECIYPGGKKTKCQTNISIGDCVGKTSCCKDIAKGKTSWLDKASNMASIAVPLVNFFLPSTMPITNVMRLQ